MKTFEKKLEDYGRVLTEIGLDLKEGDGLIINFGIWGLELAREVTKFAYKAGVKSVINLFSDDEMALARYVYGRDEIFDELEKFKVDYTEEAFKNNYHSLYIYGPNPQLLENVDSGRIHRWQRAYSLATKPIQHYEMDNLAKWCVALVPTPAWAKMVFPELEEKEGLEKLWSLVFEINRINEDNPVEAWRTHDKALKEKEDYLNKMNFEKLILRGPGTELEVHLVENHQWIGGSSQLERGDRFMANMPTEEIFTMPNKWKVEGRVRATKPLSVQGRLVEDFSMEFKEGRLVSFQAGKGEEVLESLLDMDQGARHLGELALVAESSPIARTGLLFYDTLFDENASCHLALGKAYGENLRNYEGLSSEEKEKLGMNDSIIHVDFMVGGPEFDVIGVDKAGNPVKIFERGNWV